MIWASLVIFGLGDILDAVNDSRMSYGVSVQFEDGVKALSYFGMYLSVKVGDNDYYWLSYNPHFTSDDGQFPLHYTNGELTVKLMKTKTDTGVTLVPAIISFPAGATEHELCYAFYGNGTLPIPDPQGQWMVDFQGARSFRMEFTGATGRGGFGTAYWEGVITEAPMALPIFKLDTEGNPPPLPVIARPGWTTGALMGGVEYEVTHSLYTYWGSGTNLSLYSSRDSVPAFFGDMRVNVTIANFSGGVEMQYNIHNSGSVEKVGTIIGRADVRFVNDRAPTRVATDIADACLSADWARCVRFDFSGSWVRGPVTSYHFLWPFSEPVAAPIGDDTAIVWAWDVRILAKGVVQRSFKVVPASGQVPGGGNDGDGSSGGRSGGGTDGENSDSKGMIGGIVAVCAVVVIAVGMFVP